MSLGSSPTPDTDAGPRRSTARSGSADQSEERITHYNAVTDRAGLAELALLETQPGGDLVISVGQRRALVDFADMVDAILSPSD